MTELQKITGDISPLPWDVCLDMDEDRFYIYATSAPGSANQIVATWCETGHSGANITYLNKAANLLPELVAQMEVVVAYEEKQYKLRKDAADDFNNNTPGVGQQFDYASYSPLPPHIKDLKALIEKAKK